MLPTAALAAGVDGAGAAAGAGDAAGDAGGAGTVAPGAGGVGTVAGGVGGAGKVASDAAEQSESQRVCAAAEVAAMQISSPLPAGLHAQEGAGACCLHCSGPTAALPHAAAAAAAGLHTQYGAGAGACCSLQQAVRGGEKR